MGNKSGTSRISIWAICTLMALAGAGGIGLEVGGRSTGNGTVFFGYLALLIGGFVVIVISETIFGMKKDQAEVDRDAAITGIKHRQISTVLAICPKCKSRIPSESRYCPECGTDVQPRTQQQAAPSGPLASLEVCQIT